MCEEIYNSTEVNMSSVASIFNGPIGEHPQLALLGYKRPLLEAHADSLLKNVIEMMRDYDVTTIPVYENVAEGEEGECIRGGKSYKRIISLADIVGFLLAQGSSGIDSPIKDVIASTVESSFDMRIALVSDDDMLRDVVEKMCQGYRLLIFHCIMS
jgi:hypothetical protein